MVRSLLLTIAMLLSAGAVLAQTVLQGTVKDDKGEGLIGATVKVLKGGEFVRGTITTIAWRRLTPALTTWCSPTPAMPRKPSQE